MPQSLTVSHMTVVRARLGCSAQVQACLNQLIEPTLQMPGCLHFALQHSHSDPQQWHVAGYWQDNRSMQAYFNSPLMDIYSVLVTEQVVEHMDFQTFSEVQLSRLQMRAG